MLEIKKSDSFRLGRSFSSWVF